MFNFFKKKTETVKIPDALDNNKNLETWVVRWNRRYGNFSSDYEEVARFFMCKEEAVAFKEDLEKAINLLGHTSHHLTKVTCNKVDNNKMQ